MRIMKSPVGALLVVQKKIAYLITFQFVYVYLESVPIIVIVCYPSGEVDEYNEISSNQKKFYPKFI